MKRLLGLWVGELLTLEHLSATSSSCCACVTWSKPRAGETPYILFSTAKETCVTKFTSTLFSIFYPCIFSFLNHILVTCFVARAYYCVKRKEIIFPRLCQIKKRHKFLITSFSNVVLFQLMVWLVRTVENNYQSTLMTVYLIVVYVIASNVPGVYYFEVNTFILINSHIAKEWSL